VTIRFLDHAVRLHTSIGVLNVSPGMVNMDAFPQLWPHLGERATRFPPATELRHLPRELRRCCPPCEAAFLTEPQP
jgi:hypothetical protein